MTRQEWLEARTALLEKEKAHIRAGDEIAKLRQALPKYEINEDYCFEGEKGPVTLSELFEGRSQLIVQHFMFGADAEAGCPFCSFWADGYNPMIKHMNQRDISFAVVSRGSANNLSAYKARMGWSFNWVSSAENTFNNDFNVSPSNDEIARGKMHYNFRETEIHSHENHGTSVFEKDKAGKIYHTYSTYGRGLNPMNAAYAYIDLTPKGRQEDDLPFGMAWVRRHDEY